MKFNFKTLAAFMALSTVMTGCSKDNTSSNSSGSPLMTSADNAVSDMGGSAESGAGEYDAALGATDCTIKFDNENISATGDGVKVNNNVVSITMPGVYELTGSCSDCKIEISAGKKDEVSLLLNNVSLSSKNGSVIDCESAKTLTLFTNDGTKNSLTDGVYSGSEDEADAAVFTRSDLVLNGRGELNINGTSGDAVKCKDAIAIYSGSLNVSAADDGITGKDSVTVYGGTVSVTSGGDGIKSTNDTDIDRGNITIAGGELEITSEKDGIQAEKALTMSGGTITITAGGEAADAEVAAQSSPWDRDRRGQAPNGQSAQSEDNVSQKGMKAGSGITISDGEINVKSADDSIHAAGASR